MGPDRRCRAWTSPLNVSGGRVRAEFARHTSSEAHRQDPPLAACERHLRLHELGSGHALVPAQALASLWGPFARFLEATRSVARSPTITPTTGLMQTCRNPPTMKAVIM